MNKPVEHVTLSVEEGEALIARVHRSTLAPADAGMVEHIIRMYCWVACALQEAKLSVKRLRVLLFGPSRTSQTPPASATSAPLRDARGKGRGRGAGSAVSEKVPDCEAVGCEGGAEISEGEAVPQPKGGHRPGTGRLGTDVYVGATPTACRHEELAVGQRCPVCGQGTLYELPPGSEIRIDGHAWLSAMRYTLNWLRVLQM